MNLPEHILDRELPDCEHRDRELCGALEYDGTNARGMHIPEFMTPACSCRAQLIVGSCPEGWQG